MDFKQKGFTSFYVLLIGILLIISLFFGYQFLTKKDQSVNDLYSTPSPSTQPKSLDHSDQIKLSKVFEEFKGKSFQDGKLVGSDNKFNLFKDEKMGISFYYPAQIYLKSYHSTYTDYYQNRHETLSILASNNKEDSEFIDYLVKCEQENEIEPKGICTESISQWLRFNIEKQKNEYSRENFIKDIYDPEGDSKTEEIDSFIANSEVTRNLNGSPAYSYSVLVDRPKGKYIVNLSTATDISKSNIYKLTIWSILNSFSF